MRSKLGMRVAFAAAALLSGGDHAAKADFWSDAGAPYKGVTIRGVSESTPPSNYVKDVLAPAFTKATGHQRRVRGDVLGPDVRQGDQGHGGQHRHL